MEGIPVLYDYNNAYTSSIKPGMIHSRNTTLTWYFERILTQKLFSVYEFNLPDEWDKDYFLYVLFLYGFGAVLNTDKYGVIFQQCTLTGYNVYYRPSRVLISNPLLNSRELTINQDCALIKCAPDYRGVYDIISYYSDQMSVLMEAFGINAFNSKFSWIFAAENGSMAESFKKMYDKLASGEPAVVVDKKLFDDEGDPRWVQFDQNLKQNFIGKDILECMSVIENMFCTTIGLPNANYEKRERLLVDEVNANNESTRAMADVWKQTIEKGFETANEMFNLNLSIRYRYDQQEVNDVNPIDNRTV